VQSVMSHSDALMRGQAIAGAGWRFVALHGGRRMVRTVSQVARSDFTVPRFATAALMIAMVGGASLYGAVLGGRMPAVIEAVAASTGFAVERVEVAGNAETSEIDVLGAIGLNGYTPLLGFDARAARERIAALPWVKSVAVRKTYPATIEVRIVERRPFAIWQRGDQLDIVDRFGKPIIPYPGAGYTNLPLVVGEGAAARASDFIARIAAYPDIASHVVGHVRVADRRWDLRLDNGVTIHLPEQGEIDALAEVARLNREQGLLARDIVAIDMRLPDRIAIRLAHEAAEARQAALKEQLTKLQRERRT